MTNGCDSSSCGLAPGVPAYYHTHTKKISHSTTKIYIVLGWILNYNAKKKKKKLKSTIQKTLLSVEKYSSLKDICSFLWFVGGQKLSVHKQLIRVSLLIFDSMFAIVEAMLSKRLSIRLSFSRLCIIQSNFWLTLSAMSRASNIMSGELLLSSELFLAFFSSGETETFSCRGERVFLLADM